MDRPSPNFDERTPNVKLQYIVLHYTGMTSCAAALQRLCNPQAKVSAHYVIDESGGVFRLVNETKRAWHAGKSFWRGETDLNSASIGIELVNPGHEFGYKPYPAAQIEALRRLLKDIAARHGLDPLRALLAHSDIAPDRKEDPGELFPWQELSEAGLGVWPQPVAEDYSPVDAAERRTLLQQIGYVCGEPEPERLALLAFQRHYDPHNLTGLPENQTMARLRAVARMMKE